MNEEQAKTFLMMLVKADKGISVTVERRQTDDDGLQVAL